MKIVTAEQMGELDRRAVQEGIPEKRLIEQAGRAAAEWVLSRYPREEWRVLVLAGRGHNGADAIVVGSILRARRYRVTILKASEKNFLNQVQLAVESKLSRQRTLVIDGLFGTGLNRPLQSPFIEVIGLLARPGLETIAVDIPSGLNANDGKPMGAAVVARHTLTFGLPKLGLVQEHAADYVGKLHVLKIGFPEKLISQISTPYDLIAPQEVSGFFLPRKRSAHKGNFGHVVVAGGSIGFAGAPALAARAALRAGAGLVTLLVPAAIYRISAEFAGPEIMTHPCGGASATCFRVGMLTEIATLLSKATAMVLGPGLGRDAETRLWVEALIRSSSVPLVLDADALNGIADQSEILREAHGEIVMTPHPGEMGRLLRSTAQRVQEDRFGAARTFAEKHRVTVVLKGARTVIAHPESKGGGEGFRFSVNALAGNPGMASGGCGDALSGIMGAILARREPIRAAVRAAVWIHAMAGDLAMPETGGGSAGDLIEALPRAQAVAAGHFSEGPFKNAFP